jgi:ribulose-5-phosphate 4-epimerase/fuculose-1-phosphate aldolase
VSATRDGVLPISQQASIVLGSLGYHDYEGIALNPEEKPRLVKDLGDNVFLMLRNHGLLTVGGTVADAFVAMYLFESTCRIQARAQALSDDLIRVEPKVLSGTAMMAKTVMKGGGMFAWPGLLRRLDRIDPSFRT